MNRSEKAGILAAPIASLNPHTKDVDPVVFGVSQARELAVIADAGSDSSLTFATDISPNVLLDRCVFIEYEVRAAYSTGGAVNNFNQSDFALAQFPLQRVMKSLTVTLNNNAKTVTPHQYHNALSKYYLDWRNEASNSMCPSQPDACNNVLAQGRAENDALINNLLLNSPYRRWQLGNGDKNSRGSFHVKDIMRTADNGNAGDDLITVTYVIREPIHHPFFDSVLQRDTLANISTIRLDMVFLPSLLPMLTIGRVGSAANNLDVPSAAYCTITGGQAAPLMRPKLLLRQYNPSVSIPQSVSMPYSDMIVRTYPVTGATDAADGTNKNGSFQSGQISLPCVPDRLYFFCARKLDLTSYNQADAWAVIQNFTIRTDNDQGAFTAADQAQIYQQCVRNGLEQTFSEFANLQGSVVCVDINNGDLGGYVGGTSMNFTFDVSGTVLNTTFDDWDHDVGTRENTTLQVTEWKLFVIAVTHGQMVAQDNQLELKVGNSVSSVAEIVSKGPSQKYTAPDNVENKASQGFFRDFRKGFKKGFGTTSHIIDKAADIAGLVSGHPMEAQALKTGNSALRELIGGGYQVKG